MVLIFEGHTFEEMVEAIHENEELKNEVKELKEKLDLVRHLNKVQKKYIEIKDDKIDDIKEEYALTFSLKEHYACMLDEKNDKIEQLEEDLSLLEDAHDKLLVKYDELVSSILDLVCDCDKM